jgi:NADH:ubiquinone reductase (H+-translocating)
MRVRNWLGVGFGGLALGMGALIWRTREAETHAAMLGGWPRVVVAGAGFGGLRAARELAHHPFEVLVLDQQNFHLFQPLLYQVATAGLEPESIAQPVRRILGGLPNVRFQLARISGFDLDRKAVLTDQGAIRYDYLVVSVGSETNFFGNQEFSRHSLGLKNLDEAVDLRNHLLTMFERAIAEPDKARRAALLTFVIVGGGPTGVEFAGALAELIRMVLVRDYPTLDMSEVRVILVEALPALLNMLPGPLQQATVESLRSKGVEVRLGLALKDVEPGRIRFADGSDLPSHTLVWAAGVRAHDLAGTLGLAQGRGGRVTVEPTLQVPERPEVYVIGDMAYLEENGRPLPMVAPVAIQQGVHAGRNIRRQAAGQPLEPFRYRDQGTMATIGRNAAVAHLWGLQLTGYPAWVMWLTVHLLFLIGFRNRLVVLINWAWDYLFYDRAVRLISRR